MDNLLALSGLNNIGFGGFIWRLAIVSCSMFYFLRSMHMFQLNSYRADTQFKWFGKNIKWFALNSLAPVCSTAVCLLFAERLRYGDGGAAAVWCVSALIMVLGVLLFGLNRVKAKKPLVYTHRVIRMCISAAIVYVVLFCLLSARFHSLLFAPLLVILSLALTVVAGCVNHPVEKANNRRYINDAKRVINSHPNLVTIGITGSYGKTSVKYYLNKLLSVKYSVLMTPESYNTTLGVVKTVRGSLKATHEIFICEMGAKWVGDIKEICDIVRPKHSVLTSIAPQHLETMKSMDNIVNTKFEIVDCITDGTVFLNYDNPYIRDRATDKNTVTYGITAADAAYIATDISVCEKGTEFTVSKGGESARFSTRLIGAHAVQNITAAICVAHVLGICLNELVLPVKRLEPVPHRLQIINRGDCTIIDDAFNSNPSGANAALDVLKLFDGLKILITPGMIELGGQQNELNREFGANAAGSCDYAVLIGERQSLPVKEGLLGAGFPDEKIKVFSSFNGGIEFAYSIDGGGRKKIILIENDLPDNY